MKKLLILALLLAAAWQAWKRYPELLDRPPDHEAVIQNHATRPIERLRLRVDGQTFVRERLESGGEATFPFRVARDASFQMVWQWGGTAEELSWRGGLVPRGPMVQRHRIAIQDDGGVIYRPEVKPGT